MILLRLNLIFLLLLSLSLRAQKNNRVKFGEVNKSDLHNFSNDSSAEALILYDRGDIGFTYNELNGGISIISNYHLRIKILKNSGSNFANITIPYVKSTSGNEARIRNLQGVTYNEENGEIIKTKLTKESIFDEHIHDKDYQKKITMPNVKAGSVIEYSYTTEAPLEIRRNPRTWYFQSAIPNLWSELTITIPEYLHYKIFFGGYFPLHTNTSEQASMHFAGAYTSAMKHHYIMKNTPAFQNEQYISSSNDYISKIEFELASVLLPGSAPRSFTETWEDINETLLKSEEFWGRLNKTNFLSDLAAPLSQIQDSTQRLNAAFAFMSRNLTWDEDESVFAQDDLKKVFNNKKGNAAELNLLLVSLMKMIGFDSDPVILSTRENGKINRAFAILKRFNYTICRVKMAGKNILMDATDPYSKPGLLPLRCLNGEGLVISKSGPRFISLYPSEKYQRTEKINALIDLNSGEIKGKCYNSYSGYNAVELRKLIHSLGENKLKETYFEKPDWHAQNIKLEYRDSLPVPLKISYNFISEFNNNVPGIIYINPILTGKVEENPFRMPQRRYPVDLARLTELSYTAYIKIPEGYLVDESPKPASIILPDDGGVFNYLIDIANGMIRVSSQISITRTMFMAEEYSYLGEFYDHIIQKHSEQIVLKAEKSK